MSTGKKIPERMCVACRQMKPKKEMLRVVKNAQGEINLDFRGKAPGRGAYVCDDPACIEKCAKTRLLNRVFEMQIPDEIYERIKEEYLAGKK